MEQLRSILIIQTAFIGDVILATALIGSLKEKFPDASIDFLVRKGNEGLIAGNPQIRECIVFDKSKKYKNLMALIGKIRSSRYDYVINVQRFFTTGLITVLSGARKTIGFDKNPLSILFSKRIKHQQQGLHEVERNHKLIEALTGGKAGRPAIYPTLSQLEKTKPYKSGEYITLSPASVWFTKQLKKEKWVEFLRALPDHMRVYLLGAPVDKDLCNVIKVETGSERVINLAGELTLVESAALMRDARMNYVNDSAPMHLASAMNAPVSAVFCSTIPAFGFGPLSDRSFIIETEEPLTCRPCGLHGLKACPEGHFKCALTIKKEQLLETLG